MWRAALCADWRKHMSAGEQAVLLRGADRRQAMILRRYCEGLLEAPRLKREVRRNVTGMDNCIEFRNGSVLEIATNDARLIRGSLTYCCSHRGIHAFASKPTGPYSTRQRLHCFREVT